MATVIHNSVVVPYLYGSVETLISGKSTICETSTSGPINNLPFGVYIISFCSTDGMFSGGAIVQSVAEGLIMAQPFGLAQHDTSIAGDIMLIDNTTTFETIQLYNLHWTDISSNYTICKIT